MSGCIGRRGVRKVAEPDRDAGSVAFGEAVRWRRRRRGMTQAELAAACGVTTAAARQWEAGIVAVTVPRLVAIARALGVRPSTLVACLDAGRATRGRTPAKGGA